MIFYLSGNIDKVILAGKYMFLIKNQSIF